MKTTESHPASSMPGAVDQLDEARLKGQRADSPLNANQEEAVEELEELDTDRDRARRRRQLRLKQPAEAKKSELPEDPFQWIGRKVRRKKDGATFIVRTVFKNQRVELEKKWMTYVSDVPTLRAGYERCI